MVETVTNIAVAVAALAAVVVIALSVREFVFLRRLRPFLPLGEYLPLFDALLNRAGYVTFVGAYLLVLTIIGAFLAALDLPQVAAVFPPIRVINAVLLLGLLSGPIYIGRAMRRLPPQQ